jgi:hypothetical protein
MRSLRGVFTETGGAWRGDAFRAVAGFENCLSSVEEPVHRGIPGLGGCVWGIKIGGPVMLLPACSAGKLYESTVTV